MERRGPVLIRTPPRRVTLVKLNKGPNMQSKLISDDDQRLLRHFEDRAIMSNVRDASGPDVRDLRATDPSAKRDRSQHRRSAWLYDDLLN